jgi:predicted ATPase
LAPDLDTALAGIMFLSGLDPEDATWSLMDPRKRRDEVRDAFIRFVISLAERAPTLLVVEDLHWIDRETHALLDTLLKRTAAARVLMIVDYRSHHEPIWSHSDRATRLDLEPLPEAIVRRMIELLIPDPEAIAALGNGLIRQAAGNPFFLEEIVRALAERQVLQGNPGAYRLAEAAISSQVPSSVRAVLEARIDRLPAAQKRLLQAAAVVGVPCSVPLLAVVLDGIPEESLYQHLLCLTAIGLFHETGLYPETLYAFKHALIQEVARKALPLQRRRQLHAAVVRGLELIYPARRMEYLEFLAYHSAEGELWDRLAVYGRQAGRKAAGQSAYPEAIKYFEQALTGFERLPKSEQIFEDMIETRFELRNALFPLGEIELDLTNLRQAQKLAENLNDTSKLAWISSYLARDLALRGTADEALTASRDALALAEQIGDADLQVVSFSYVGQAYCALGEYRESAAVMRTLLGKIGPCDVSRRFGLPLPGQIMFRCWLIWALSALGPSSELDDGLVGDDVLLGASLQ